MLLMRHRNTTSLVVGSSARRYALMIGFIFFPLNDYLLSFSQPPPPGQKRVREDWEITWYLGMFGAMGLAGVLHYYKPDTRCAFTNTPYPRVTDFHVPLVYKPGHWQRRRRGWKRGARSTNMSQHHCNGRPFTTPFFISNQQ